jgi:hypothetical protein
MAGENYTMGAKQYFQHLKKIKKLYLEYYLEKFLNGILLLLTPIFMIGIEFLHLRNITYGAIFVH